jgi:hypothetical protein
MAASSKLTWRGPQVLARFQNAAVAAITEFDLRVEAAAKAQLYPGHGKLTGNLQRSIVGAPGRIEGRRVRGYIGTKGVRYALRLHRRYQYLTVALQQERGNFPAIFARHAKAGG